MSGDVAISFGCKDDFSQLCALSITESLTPDESRRLEEHIVACAQCASLLGEYRSLASTGMARLGAVRSSTADEFNPGFIWARDEAKARLLRSLEVSVMGRPTLRQPNSIKTAVAKARVLSFFDMSRAKSLLWIAAVLMVATIVAYQTGLKRGVERPAQVNPSYLAATTTLRQQLTDVQAQRAALNEKLVVDSKAIAAWEGRAARAEKDLAQLHALNVSLEAKAQDLGNQNEQRSTSVAALLKEREALQQKLRDTESLLQGVRENLSASQDERQKILLQSAILETQINRLSTQLREREETSHRQEQYLASDRDIRELMGARQLYIADVFDIDSRGKTKKPFGRVFYTRGKSLIFYAFDLDQQPGYREAKAFQAWGRPGSSQATPVSLGILYMDNELNRRWILEFNDPRVLEEINAVFVTVEPKGGSNKPTNKPFLLAYLHTAPPNHP